ncbi:helix-turn-helix domain-containing protein [Halomonas salicampi]|uniref:Helix-turn-helix domain-containing protein n=1 Tax=Vreelandella salicampi TaxID=1449798 RepID=A0A7Z0LK85_9GAMM|nr:helix-turn-helix domain-containing protein [Halomonas salicampi]
MSQRQVARDLGIHNSTISRELRRNAADDGYEPELAQRLSNDRRRTAWKWTKRLPSMINIVAKQLREEWSLDQISGFMAPCVGIGVSHLWSYSLVWNDKARGGDLFVNLSGAASIVLTPRVQASAKSLTVWASNTALLRSMTGSPSDIGRGIPSSRASSNRAGSR